jgi:cell division inhibitor SepF
MVFLGLGDDEERVEYVDDVGFADEEPSYDSGVSAPSLSDVPPRVKTLGPDEGLPAGAVVRSIPEPADRLHLVAPTNFNDAKEIGDQLKRNVPVIINLVDVDRELRRRLVDFASGLAYALSAKMERVAENVFLVTPANLEVSAEERRKMREHGLFSGV